MTPWSLSARSGEGTVLPVTFAFDEPPTVEERNCDLCGRRHRLIKAFVLRDRTAHSVVLAALHRHEDVSEAWMDVILGTLAMMRPTTTSPSDAESVPLRARTNQPLHWSRLPSHTPTPPSGVES
jgi:hypothetical protein